MITVTAVSETDCSSRPAIIPQRHQPALWWQAGYKEPLHAGEDRGPLGLGWVPVPGEGLLFLMHHRQEPRFTNRGSPATWLQTTGPLGVRGRGWGTQSVDLLDPPWTSLQKWPSQQGQSVLPKAAQAWLRDDV